MLDRPIVCVVTLLCKYDSFRKAYTSPSMVFGLVIALRPHTPKHIRGGWSHYTDTSEPVEGGVQL
jgi:hypothetical protein